MVAGLTLNYNSGAVEGTVNCIKRLKAAMYGRAKPDVLRKRGYSWPEHRTRFRDNTTVPGETGYLTTGFSHLTWHEECRRPTGNLVSTPGELSAAAGPRAPQDSHGPASRKV